MNEWEKKKLDEYIYKEFGDIDATMEKAISKSIGFQSYCLRCAKKEFKDALSKELKPVIDKIELFLRNIHR